MTLKYKFTHEPNPKYDKKKMLNDIKAEAKLRLAARLLTTEDAKNNNLINQAKERLDDRLRVARSVVSKSFKEKEKLTKVHITSDREWVMYPEYIGDDCGRTKYSPKELFKVDTSIDYNRFIPELDENGEPRFDEDGELILKEGSVKEAIKVASNKALAPLKDYRKKRREVASIERTFHIPGIPFQPTYKVYIGNGQSGEAFEYSYVDAWSGYNGMKFTKPEQKDNYFIHMEGGTFLKLQEVAKTRKVFEPKKPRTNEHHVGIELEFISKMDKFELAMELCKENVQDFVYLTDDGSIKFYDKNGNPTDHPQDDFKYRHELTMVAPEPLVHEVIRRMLRAINRDGKSKVGARCGFHVHLDMRNRDKKLAFHNLSKAQTILYAMNPRSRLDGTTAKGNKDTVWSKKINTADFDTAEQELAQAGGNARYYGINIQALSKHSTIEIRIHSGSTNEEKISNWVKILTTIVNLTFRVTTEAHKAETFCEYYGLDNTICDYIKARIAKFKDKDGNHVTINEVA